MLELIVPIPETVIGKQVKDVEEDGIAPPVLFVNVWLFALMIIRQLSSNSFNCFIARADFFETDT